MRVLMWSLVGFVAGLVVGYVLIVAGWAGYALYARIADGDGGKLMSVLFLAAPVGGLVGGLAGAFWSALRAARRHERRIHERKIEQRKIDERRIQERPVRSGVAGAAE